MTYYVYQIVLHHFHWLFPVLFICHLHIPKEPLQEFWAHGFRHLFVGNLITAKRRQKIGVTSSGGKKSILVYVYKGKRK